MFQSPSERIITQLVDQVFTHERRYDRQHLGNGQILHRHGMVIEIALNVNDPSIEHEGRYKTTQKRWYYIAFCNNVSVFQVRRDVQGEQGLRHFSSIHPSEWINTSNHDTCWRSDGLDFLSQAYFKMCRACNLNIAPANLESECDIGFSSLWRDVKMTTASDNEDYKQVLVDIREAPTT